MTGNSRRMKKDEVFINWAIINHDDEISIPFLNKGSNLSYTNRRGLREYINDFTKKWEREISRLSLKASGKTHFRIGGGNYSFFFMMPKAVKTMQKLYPLMSVSLELFEPRHTDHVVAAGMDYCLGLTDIDGSLKSGSYRGSRRMIKDALNFCVSKEVFTEYEGDVSRILQSYNTLYGRPYLTGERKQELKNELPIPGRENETARISSDHEFLSYLLLKKSAGIWAMSDTYRESDVCKLKKYYRIKRFGFMRISKQTNNLDKEFYRMVATR